MSIIENAILKQVKHNLSRTLDVEHIPEIPADGIREHRDIPYKNRDNKELLMDIFEPEVPEGTELPVIVNIHGGGLIDGSKNYSTGFIRPTFFHTYCSTSPCRRFHAASILCY